MSSVDGKVNVDLYSLIHLITTDDANVVIIYEDFESLDEFGPTQTILYEGSVYNFREKDAENHLVGQISFGENDEGDNQIEIYVLGTPDFVS